MPESTWKTRLGPLLPAVATLAALSVAVSASADAGGAVWRLGACPGDAADTTAGTPPAVAGSVKGEPWFRLDPGLDARGTLAHQRLSLGRQGDPRSAVVDLPPESAAAGPFGRVVLVTADDGTRSTIEAVDLDRGCRRPLAEESNVVRRVTVDPAGAWLYEFRVDRATRADLGVWRRPLGTRGAPATRVLEPIGPDERFGPTFSTELSWEIDGSRLVVASCGEAACRTRVLDPASGVVVTHADPGMGEPLGLVRGGLVGYAACRGLPCPVLLATPGGRNARVLAPEAALAVVVATPVGPRVVAEMGQGPSALRVIDPAGRVDELDLRLPDGLRLVPSGSRAQGGSRVPAGWLLLAPDGRPGAPDAGRASLLVSPLDGRIVRLTEVTR